MTLVSNATAVDFDPPRVRYNVEVLIDGPVIVDVAEGTAANHPDGKKPETVIDAAGALLYPGLVCAHHHYYSGLARGILAQIGPTPDFPSTLRNLWWRLDQAANEESLFASSLICSMDAIRAGTTAVIDHNASPRCITGSLGAIKRGMEQVGLRGTTCYETSDRHGRDGMIAGIEENLAFAREIDTQKADGSWKGLVEAHIGGHALFTLPEEALERLAAATRETGRGFHVHVAEDRYDVSFSHATYGEDLVSRLSRHGLVDKKTLAVHGTFLAPHEIDRINTARAFVVHNCRSNMNNGVGYNNDLAAVSNLALGTDGIGADMLAALKHAFFKHRDAHGPLQPDAFLSALARGNQILEGVFDGCYGRIEPGYAADLVINDYDPPTPLLPQNIGGHIAFGLDAKGTRTVIIGGNVVYKDFAFPFATAAIYESARREAKALWERMDAIAP